MRKTHSRAQGFSLPEIMVTIAVVAILTAVGIVNMSNVADGAQDRVARAKTEQLNQALKAFAQSNWDIRTAAAAGSADDEFKVLRSLQYKPPARSGRFSIGAPYFPPTWNPVSSASTEDYRIEWNGVNFRVLVPDQAGTGLKVDFESTDQGTPYTFPTNYKPEGLLSNPS